LLLPGERKSVEPMAARLAPNDCRRLHQSLHHLVADAPWNDEEMLAEVRRYVLPTMQKQGPVVAWIVDDTGFPKQGKHSVGVARQYCGQLGKSDNCQAAVSLSVSTWASSLPIAWRLYLPEVWCQDAERCRQAGVPEEVGFQTKPEIALGQMRVMGRARNSALTSPNWDCNMQWALSRTPPSGNRGSNPCRRRHENQGGVRLQSGCNAMRTISLSR
jgi:SRSO17 transposase